jgi:endonuclease YncB( thermonuclease family)
MAKVEIIGVVDVEQFHPLGDSDADTVVVQVKEIRVDGEPTKQFEGAFVLDHGEPRALVRNGCLRVRLEGLDAPELHYPTTEPEPVARPNATFRQPRGAACAKALGEALGGSGLVRARAVTEVELAGDIFDVYGRFIGEVIADTPGPGTVHINSWLLENGFAFPAIYTSASRRQAKQFLELAREAKRFGRGVWRAYTDELISIPSSSIATASRLKSASRWCSRSSSGGSPYGRYGRAACEASKRSSRASGAAIV